jgi:hypothetical protein
MCLARERRIVERYLVRPPGMIAFPCAAIALSDRGRRHATERARRTECGVDLVGPPLGERAHACLVVAVARHWADRDLEAVHVVRIDVREFAGMAVDVDEARENGVVGESDGLACHADHKRTKERS